MTAASGAQHPAKSTDGTVEVRSANGVLLRRVPAQQAQQAVAAGAAEWVTKARRPYIVVGARGGWRAEDSKTTAKAGNSHHHIQRRCEAYR